MQLEFILPDGALGFRFMEDRYFLQGTFGLFRIYSTSGKCPLFA